MPAVATPSLTAPANGAVTSSQPAITGVASPAGSTLAIYIDNALVGTTTSSGVNGNYSLAVPSPLSNGAHTVDVYLVSQSLYSTPVSSSFTASSSLPVHFISFTAAVNFSQPEPGVDLNFTTNEEINISRYIIERSADGVLFKAAAQVLPQKSSGLNLYRVTDAQPLYGVSYYRVKEVDADGAATYSHTAMVRTDKAMPKAALYPNPVSALTYLHLYLPGKQQVKYAIVDASGKTFCQGTLALEAGNSQVTLPVQSLAKGMYKLRLLGDKLDTVISFVR